jgi:hypothetical protein
MTKVMMAYLRCHWDDAYDFEITNDKYTARALNSASRCAACLSPWPCEQALLAEHNLAL